MKPPFLDIIPHRFRRRSLGVTLSVFTRALLNFAGLAVLIPVLVIILDTEGIRSNRWLAALYDFGGFTSDRTFILTVCACVVAVILFKSLANLALYKIERTSIGNFRAGFTSTTATGGWDSSKAPIRRFWRATSTSCASPSSRAC